MKNSKGRARRQGKKTARKTARTDKKAARKESRAEKKDARQGRRGTKQAAKKTAQKQKQHARQARKKDLSKLRKRGASKNKKKAVRKQAKSAIKAASDKKKAKTKRAKTKAKATIKRASTQKKAAVRQIKADKHAVTGGPFKPFKAIGKVFSDVGEGIVSAVDNFSKQHKRNQVRIWAIRDRFTAGYPERSHSEWARHTVGICFSGGGTRSASASLGQMRALHKLRLIDSVDVIGAVSGGSWFSVPYTYLPAEISDARFLGTHVPPERITKAWLNKGDRSKNGKGGENIYAHCVARSDLFTLWNVGQVAFNHTLSKIQLRNKKDDETWGQMLGRIFLKPLGLFGPHQRYLTGRPRDRNAILRRNRHLEPDDFQCVVRKRPWLVVAGTVINWNLAAKAKSAAKPGKKGEKPIYPVEFTPLYTGTNVRYEGRDTAGKAVIGGGFVEPLGFDTPAPRRALSDDRVKVRTRRAMNRLSLQDIMAVSGAAPAWHLLQISTLGAPLRRIPLLGQIIGVVKAASNLFPEFLTWHIEQGDKVNARNRHYADGGFGDNLGLIPLLKRGVDRIVVFVNTSQPLGETIDSAIPSLFGRDDLADDIPWARGRNHVLAEQGISKDEIDGYDQTVTGLRNALADADGGAVVHCGRYKVVENAWHGVKGGREVTIAWFYNHASKGWLGALKRNGYAKKLLDTGRFRNFPHFNTFLPRRKLLSKDTFHSAMKALEPMDLDIEQVSMLANLSAWSVVRAHADDKLKKIFD